jgi:hypothetical protein
MQRMVLMLCVGVLMAFVVPLTTVAQSWIEYRPAGGRYRVEMPDTPIVQTEDIKTDDGRTVTQIRAVVERRRTAYVVAHIDYPEDVGRDASPDTLLKRMRDGMIQNRRLRRDVALTVSGEAAREFVAVGTDGLTIIMRGVWSGNRLFQIIVGGADGVEAQPDTMRFLDSFSLVK